MLYNEILPAPPLPASPERILPWSPIFLYVNQLILLTSQTYFLWCIAVPTCFFVRACSKKLSNISQRHMSSYDIDRLHQMDFWWNSDPNLVRQLSVIQKLAILAQLYTTFRCAIFFVSVWGVLPPLTQEIDIQAGAELCQAQHSLS